MSKKMEQKDNIELISNIKIIEENDIIEKEIIKPQLKKEICKVLWIKNEIFAISFKDYGLTLSGGIDKQKEFVEIKYEGEIGKSDFKIISYE